MKIGLEMGTKKNRISGCRKKQKESMWQHQTTRFEMKGLSAQCGVLKAKGRSHWCNIPQGDQTKGGHTDIHII